MGSEWEDLTIGDLCYVTDGAHSKVDRVENGVIYLTSKNIGAGHLKLDSFDFISEESFYKLFTDTKKAQRRLRVGDVLMGIIGTFGNCYIYKDSDFFGISSSVAIIRPNFKKLLSQYLYYVISSESFKAVVNKYKGGSVQGYTNIATLKALPLLMPPLEEQQKIVDLLIPLDKKIELNRQINQTLEQMAKALFKSWFVDFDPVIDNALDAGNPIPEALAERAARRQVARANDDFQPLSDDVRQLFPTEFEESELGWIPKGWQSSDVENELTIKGGSTPSTKNLDFWEDGSIHWTSPKDLSGNSSKIILDTDRKITEAGLEKITSGLLPVNTVLMSSRAPVGYLAMSKIPIAINQGYIAIPETKRLSQEFVIYWLDSIMDEIKGVSGGTTFAEISKKTFKSIKMVVPDKGIVNAFSSICAKYLDKVTLNTEENNSLTSLRNSLLPKLISGELRLDSVEVEQAKSLLDGE